MLIIERKKRLADFNMKESHSHTHYELYYVISGSSRIFINHTLYIMDSGDMVLIPPLEIHRTTYHLAPMTERISVCFTEEYINEMKNVCGEAAVMKLLSQVKITLPANRKEYVEELLKKIEIEEFKKDEFSELLKRNYFYEMLVCLHRNKEFTTGVQTEELSENAIQEAAEYICRSFASQITLAEVAEMVHMSPSYFSRKFKSITGFGFKEYLNNIRMKEAAKLLLNTDRPITEIGTACGFSDGNYFGDAFRKANGVSPRQYRRNPTA